MRFGEPLIRFEVVPSTQDVARQMALEGATPGTTVVANMMTAGRGRQGRTWIAPPGCNVCLTTIGPPVPLARVWEIGIVAGVAACVAVRQFAPTVVVRFPNDLTSASGFKLAGILVETLAVPGETRGVLPLIGIGINVNRPPNPLDAYGPVRAISLEGLRIGLVSAPNDPLSVPEVEAATLARLGEVWDEWQSEEPGKGFPQVVERWNALHDTNAQRPYVFDDVEVKCRVTHLSEDGTVTLEAPNGAIRRLNAAQVIFGGS
jgi:BirA family biotin operon repressor/biotin-[acetyl-CoA-carboxylase] ligase